ncbi:MAG: histidine kinase [Cyclobacteriaceae bacterium]
MIRQLLHIVLGFTIGVFAFIFLTFGDLFLMSQKFSLICAGLSGIILSYLVPLVSFQIGKWFKWQENFGITLLSSLIANSLIVFAVLMVIIFGAKKIYPDDLEAVSQGVFIKMAIFSLLIMLIYSILYFAYQSFRYFHSVSLESLMLETQQIDLQLMALKAQLSPHFLFNSLNTISSLINEGDDLSEKYIRNLAQVYQYTLPSFDRKVVRFEEEWAYVEANINLLKTRFGEHLTISLENEKELMSINLLPLTLQLLVENVMKHNLIDEDNPVNIRIRKEGNWFIISNNKTLKPQNVASFKMGLDNIIDRYALINEKKVGIINGKEFTVKIPLL